MAIPDEIIVVGKRPSKQVAGTYEYGNGTYGFKSSEPNFPANKRPENAQDGDIVVIAHAEDPANATAVQEAAQNVAKTVAILTDKILALSDTAEYKVGSDKITGAEIKKIWSKIQFYVTDKKFGQNRSGAITIDKSGMVIDTLDYTAFQGPGSYADPNYQNNEGMNFIILHEVMHETRAAVDYYSIMYQTFTENVKSPNLEKWYANQGGWFGRNERFVNTAVRSFSVYNGINPLPNPTWGYINE